MSGIKALEKLREFAETPPHVFREELLGFVNEIEREIAERYMKLPVDADGVPIRPGEQMADDSQRADGLGLAKWDVVSVNECAFFDMSGGLHVGKQCHHVKPDPVKELLEELLNDIDYAYDGKVTIAQLIDEYAARIREAVKREPRK